jgi:DNA (cytosine-5)-methyltransferase 1
MDLGFDLAGWQCVGQVEIDKHARAVLEKHWPEVPRHDDITTAIAWATGLGLRGRVDVVCGGAPCQDLSVAGRREGFDGSRSRLVLDMVALAEAVEARVIVYENVPGLLTSNQGRDLGVLIVALAEAGFHHVEWRVLDSQFFGVPQRRRRVFLVAGRDSAVFGGREVLVEPEGLRWNPPSFGEAREDAAAAVAGGFGGRSTAAGDIAACLNSGGNRGGFRTEPGEHLVIYAAEKLGTLTTTFGPKNYSNVQEVSQGSIVAVRDVVVREDNKKR